MALSLTIYSKAKSQLSVVNTLQIRDLFSSKKLFLEMQMPRKAENALGKRDSG
jgi:hypothetical protein